MAEIGCYSGESTVIFARNCRQVIAVDPWSDTYRKRITCGCSNADVLGHLAEHPPPHMSEIRRLFEERLRSYSNVKILAMESAEASRLVADGSLDFVYIDAIHTFRHVCRDIDLWLPKVRPGGLIGGHDYSPGDWPGVVKAVNSRLGAPDEVLADTSWVKRLRNVKRAGSRAVRPKVKSRA
ncbi:MAG TPA: class I SAM-dependent methyltransferase [Pyrinomonadaceae bacterium]|jgi:predicted O-methyltransferase YrrM|nr:class I SAM-dependent methyltransferase [Pyrinomonadaceae bacterium]